MKRLVATVVAAGAAMAAVAMPTKAELQKAQEMVSDVTAADVAALKAKTKKPAEVAAKHMELAGQAGSEAEKYLLLQGAFKLYAKAGDYDAAANVIEKLQAEIMNYDPEVTVELCGAEFIRKMRENAPRLYALKENARRIIFYRKQLPIREAAVKKNPKDAQAQRKLAECHAELGDWPKALDVFVKVGGELKKMSEGETSGKVPAQELGDFWWDYETKSDTQVYKLHAAELYRKALADDSFKGLARTRAEQRVKEVAGNAAAVAADGQGTSPRTSAATGLYCVIDLSGGPNAKKYPVTYLNDMPKGGWSDEYKTTKLVLKKIKAGKDPAGFYSLTTDFYIGIFEITQKQWALVMGDCPTKQFLGAKRPVETISHIDIRGSGLAVSESSFIGRIRAKTEDDHYDLPSEAQWIYACRAGSSARFANGVERADLEKLAWWKGNSGDRTHEVGEKSPNAFGLFDMHGNVWERCLDDNSNLSGDDPEGTIGSVSVSHGGCWGYDNDFASCGMMSRCPRSVDHKFNNFGFRLCLPLAGGASAQAPAAATTTTGSIELKTGGDSPFTVKGNEATLELKNGAKLEFVKCPSGWVKVVDDYENKVVRKVKITRPFWIMKQGLRNDDVIGRTLEKWGTGHGFIEPNQEARDKFCSDLTDELKGVLPKGYVVRPPSLVEWEYAYHAGDEDPGSEPFGSLLKGHNFKTFHTHKGSSPVNKWRLHDFHVVEQIFDRVDSNQVAVNEKHPENISKLPDAQSDKDLFFWSDDLDSASYLVRRPAECALGLKSKNSRVGFVRLVIGPDLVSEWKAKLGK